MNTCRLRRTGAVWFLGFAMALATVAAAPSGDAVAQGTGQASYGGVTFTYDTSLATGVSGQTAPNTEGQDIILTELRPEHPIFLFEGYPVAGVWTPLIRVIPLEAYRAQHARSVIGPEFARLERYLGGQGGDLPSLLPQVNAERIITEKVAPVSGAGVSGVRFVASYAQGIVPVDASNITYNFIGLTADRQYYVEGNFPVALVTPLDPIPANLTAESVQAYNRAVAERLRSTGAEGFTPGLDKLDKMMASIQVAGGAVGPTTPGMPRTGSAQDSSWLLLAGAAAGVVAVGAGILILRRTSPPGR